MCVSIHICHVSTGLGWQWARLRRFRPSALRIQQKKDNENQCHCLDLTIGLSSLTTAVSSVDAQSLTPVVMSLTSPLDLISISLIWIKHLHFTQHSLHPHCHDAVISKNIFLITDKNAVYQPRPLDSGFFFSPSDTVFSGLRFGTFPQAHFSFMQTRGLQLK